jgi:3-deoxy-D-manno-octulosonic-acid transferase
MTPPPASRVPLWYTAAWILLLPLAALYLCWRGLRQRDYLRHWPERFLGRGAGPAVDPANAPVWVHAVSLGETRAAQPLLERLAQRDPQARFLLTHMTPTGRAAGRELARAFPGRVTQRYLPYDLPCAVSRFLRETRPRLGVLMETEIWPNLLQAARRRGLPVVLANARLSARSLAKAQRAPRLLRAAASCIGAVGAQSADDAARLRRLYDGPIEITGNLKFDQRPDERQLERGRALRAALQARFATAAGSRPVWLFASTREGEERLLLAAWRQRARAPAAAALPEPLLLFVPRHPQRFEEVAELLRGAGAGVLRRAMFDRPDTAMPPALVPQAARMRDVPPVPGQGPAERAPLLLGDSMGELATYYAMADVALIGGSLLPLGGQNLIEACACGCPVVMGPHMYNFAAAAADALAAGAASAVADAQEALQELERIAGDPGRRARMSAAAQEFAAGHRGATRRTVELIDGLEREKGRG